MIGLQVRSGQKKNLLQAQKSSRPKRSSKTHLFDLINQLHEINIFGYSVHQIYNNFCIT